MPEQPAPPTSSAGRSGGVVVPNRATLGQRLVATLIATAIRLIAGTLRWRLHDPSGEVQATVEHPLIFAIWHNRLSLCLIIYNRYVRRVRPHRRMAAMVSASRDGALLARILELFEVEPVRGSTSRRGPQALRELVGWSDRGFDLAITPDGPRGPRYGVQEGVVALAQLTGGTILPVSYHLPWKFQIKSWDRFQVPIPFGRCDVHVGAPVQIPREATPEEREALRQQLETTLRQITHD